MFDQLKGHQTGGKDLKENIITINHLNYACKPHMTLLI